MNAKPNLIAACWCLLMWTLIGNAQQLETQPFIQGENQAPGKLVKGDEIRNYIRKWEAATSSKYETLYSVPFRVSLDEEAEGLLVERFSSSPIPVMLINKLDDEALQTVVAYHVYDVLDKSLVVSIPGSELVQELTYGKLADWTVKSDAVETAIAQNDCRVLPCDRRKCGEDCAEQSVREVFPAMQLDN